MVRRLVGQTERKVVNLDKVTYAGNLESLESVEEHPRYRFEQIDICDAEAVGTAFSAYEPSGLIHLAAESHVDRSIDGPAAFIQTKIAGTYTLLEASRTYWNRLDPTRRDAFLFHHVSTDEVFGSAEGDSLYTEETPYRPNSPYSASKASSDHLARARHHTYGLPTLVTHCSNNYGPYQFPEKLSPLMIFNALEGKPLPVYGSEANVRDWLYVEDHSEGLLTVYQRGGQVRPTTWTGTPNGPTYRSCKRFATPLTNSGPIRRSAGGKA